MRFGVLLRQGAPAPEALSQPAAASYANPDLNRAPPPVGALEGDFAPAEGDALMNTTFTGPPSPESLAGPHFLFIPSIPAEANCPTTSTCLTLPDSTAEDLRDSPESAPQLPKAPVREPPPSPSVPSPSPPRYDSPQAICERRVALRGAWYTAQPASSIKTSQHHRRAMRLPLRQRGEAG
ncbi:hypothetical protein CDD83_9798 [Cordyceps sp. RAO-2017]|nr:hypothetical protein CDD83_9798 [Cordyceps sp. RAO-2017]